MAQIPDCRKLIISIIDNLHRHKKYRITFVLVGIILEDSPKLKSLNFSTFKKLFRCITQLTREVACVLGKM